MSNLGLNALLSKSKSPPRSFRNKSQQSNYSQKASEVPLVTQSTTKMHQNRFQSLSQLHKTKDNNFPDEPPDATARRMIYKHLPSLATENPPSLFQVSSEAILHTLTVDSQFVKSYKIDEFNCSDGISLPKWCLDEMDAEKALKLI